MKSTTFGSRLKSVRAQMGITQAQFAARVPASRAALAQWEIDACHPSYVVAESVAAVGKVSPGWLVFGEGSRFPQASKAAARQADPDQLVEEVEVVGRHVRKSVGTWRLALSRLPLGSNLTSHRNLVVLSTCAGMAVAPFVADDKILVDMDDCAPTASGHFAIWNGQEAEIVHLQMHPAYQNVKMYLATGASFQLAVSVADLAIIGRVHSIVHRHLF